LLCFGFLLGWFGIADKEIGLIGFDHPVVSEVSQAPREPHLNGGGFSKISTKAFVANASSARRP
jgi:hypothetical protein